MSVNDYGIAANKGTDTTDGLRNPTIGSGATQKSANFVDDPTSDTLGAGAASDFKGYENAKTQLRAGPGVDTEEVLDSAQVDPLGPNATEDRFAKATVDPTSAHPSGITDTIASTGNYVANKASGVAQMAYGKAAGDSDTYQAGSEQYSNP